MTTRQRFMQKFTRGSNKECWRWNAAGDLNGYGRFGDKNYGGTKGRSALAHRWAWRYAHGRFPPRHLGVLHSCDHPWCVNPHHLHLGTQSTNIQEAWDRGRHGPVRPPRKKMVIPRAALSDFTSVPWNVVASRIMKCCQQSDSGCWEWTRSRTRNGYGKAFVGTKNGIKTIMSAHKAAYLVFRGPVRAGMCVLHSCHNRGCINPDHLSLGTQRENMRQARERMAGGVL